MQKYFTPLFTTSDFHFFASLFLVSLLSLNKAAAQVRCSGGEAMNLVSDGYAIGDPHTQMYNTYWHHFQGQSNSFYYYMKPLTRREDLAKKGDLIDTGVTIDTVGFQLIVAHTYYSGNRNVIKWYMIELFDGNNIYQIYVERNPTPRVGYITKLRNSRTVQDITAVSLTTINTGVKTFSSRFKLEYTISGSYMQVRVIDQHCIDLGGSGISLDSKFTSHPYHGGYYGQLHAKTHCYQCQITGYFGDYYNNGHKAYNCKTGFITSGLVNVFTPDKLSCLVENSEVIPPAPTPPTNDWCADTTIENKVKNACKTAFNQLTTGANCCKTEYVNDCMDEQISCWTDTCATIGNDYTTTPTDTQIQNAANTEMSDALVTMPECAPPQEPPAREYCPGPNYLKWPDAEKYCREAGSMLAIINHESEFKNSENACKAAVNPDRCWTGYHRDRSNKFDNTFEWIDGVSKNPGNRINWGNWETPGEPSSMDKTTGFVKTLGSDEYCVMLDKSKGYKWDDIVCGNQNKPGGTLATPLCVKQGDISCNIQAALSKNENKLNNDNINNEINVEVKNDIKFLTFGIGIGVIITLFIIVFIRLFHNNNKTKYQKINVVSDVSSSDAASSDDEIKV